MDRINEITQIVGQKFRSFGGGQENPYNPVSMALKDQQLQFAAGVDIKAVVETVLNEAQATSTDPQHGREPDKVKPECKDCVFYHKLVAGNCVSIIACKHQQRVLNKVKPLAQYLVDYLQHKHPIGFNRLFWKRIIEQALDAYESTEQVKIRIE